MRPWMRRRVVHLQLHSFKHTHTNGTLRNKHKTPTRRRPVHGGIWALPACSAAVLGRRRVTSLRDRREVRQPPPGNARCLRGALLSRAGSSRQLQNTPDWRMPKRGRDPEAPAGSAGAAGTGGAGAPRAATSESEFEVADPRRPSRWAGSGSRRPPSQSTRGAASIHGKSERDGVRRCWICLETSSCVTRSHRSDLLSTGCACRGSAGLAHLGCLVTMAQHNGDRWTNCPTCKQEYKSTMMVPLARARQQFAEALPPGADGDSERLHAMHNMAIALEEMGRYHEALPLYKSVLEIESALNGPTDVNTLLTRTNLADCLDRVGERVSARRIYEEVVEIQTKKFGAGHELTLATKGNLASLLEVSGERMEARRLLEQVIEGNTAWFGARHADTLRAKGNLANVIKQLGERTEALRLYKSVVQDQTRLLGPTHADTLNTKANLAYMLGESGDAAAAMTLYAAVIEGNTTQLGPSHVDTLVDRGNLAELQVLVGELRPAAQSLPTIIHELTAALGPIESNRFTLIYRSALALLWQKQGRLAAAEAAYKEILPLQEALGGVDDTYAKKTRKRLETLQTGKVVSYPEL